VSGRPLLRDDVFGPPGLESTFCHFALDHPRAARVASTCRAMGSDLTRYRDPTRAQSMPFCHAGDGVRSTPMDYARLLGV
jgi:hypothetical protein